MLDGAFNLVLALNVLWFGAAFSLFSLRHRQAAKLLVRTSERSSPLFAILAEALRFLGGMNLAFMLLSVAVLVGRHLFPDALQKAILAMAIAVAHGSQFAFNAVVLRNGRRQGGPLWRVLTGKMLFIFVVDGTLMAANAAVAIAFAGLP